MSERLGDLKVLVIDAQAGGATPHYGDLLELGWAVAGASGRLGDVRSHWVIPRTARRVSRAVRELTGWSPDCIAEALDERALWDALRADAGPLAAQNTPSTGAEEPLARARVAAPTVIHFARFELPFLHDVHQRLAPEAPFPFDVVCLHAVAARLFPDLPRRNIRALAGYLGHAPELMRRSAGHVEATAFLWSALLPRLAAESITSWSALSAWLAQPAARKRSAKRVFPLDREVRRALPDRPGVYRFVRRNGDIVYVGKATSLKRRVAAHFAGGSKTTERNLEMLTQVDDIRATETASVLEAALLEVDEIKRIDPPYNVQLRLVGGQKRERAAWFARRDFSDAAPAPDAAHRVGPLPSERALTSLGALIALVDGAASSPQLQARALAVPTALGPSDDLFREGWEHFVREHLPPSPQPAARRVDAASRALWIKRGRDESEVASDESAPELWDLARVRRRLERTLVQTGLLVRRARWLRLLAQADVAFREASMTSARVLRLSAGSLIAQDDLPQVADLVALPLHAAGCAPVSAFDAGTYDRLRVLATELRRVRDEGGEVAVRFGRHVFADARLAALTRYV